MSKQVVLITGCTKGGIGYAFAKKFAQAGNHVFATARRIESLDGLEEYGCKKASLDVLDQKSIESTVQNIIDEVGHIDILVNNAGAPAIGSLLDVSFETAHHCVNTNVFGLLAITREVVKHMTKRNQGGKIVNVGSVVAYAATPWSGIYSLSKAAVHSMSDTLRMELKPFNIQVSVVAPGAVKSNIGTAGIKSAYVPEDSLYAPISESVVGRATMSQGAHSTPADVFAEEIVQKVMRSTPPRYITAGATSWKFLLYYYLPLFIKESAFCKKFGIDNLNKVKQN